MRVTKVFPGQPGEEAGIQNGDILLSFGERPIESVQDLHDWITWSQPETEIAFEVIRGGQRVEPILVNLAELDVPGRARSLNQ